MDARDRAAAKGKWYTDLNLVTMVATLAEVISEIIADLDSKGPHALMAHAAFEFTVCPLCDGRGTHVNP